MSFKFSFNHFKKKEPKHFFTLPSTITFQKINFGKKDKREVVLGLDVGTEAVKALIFKKGDKKITILGTSLQYFDRYGIFDSRDFEKDVFKKTVSKTIEEVEKQAKCKITSVFIGLPANILKGRVISQSFIRKSPKTIIEGKEENEICQEIFKQAKKDISQNFVQNFGILPEDIHFLSLKVLEIKIDGYQVPVLRGYDGKNLEFKILATFLPTHYLKNLERVIRELNPAVEKSHYGVNLKNFELIPGNQGLEFFTKDQESDAIYLDIGGEITQIFIIRNKKLDGINEFPIAGRIFSEKLSQTLGITEKTSRTLKERYSKSSLSLESINRIKEFFSSEKNEWFENLKLKIWQMNQQKLLPSTIFIFGGGSLLPEIKESISNGNWDYLLFINKPQVKFLLPSQILQGKTCEGLPKDFKNIEGLPESLNNPQYTPLLLLSYAAKT